jgi:hypothetical protein
MVSNMMLVQLKMSKWLSTLVFLSSFKFKQKKMVKFGVFFLSWIRIRIRILNVDPDSDPAVQNRCGSRSGSGSTSLGGGMI